MFQKVPDKIHFSDKDIIEEKSFNQKRLRITGSFRGGEIMFLLISQPIKHFKSFDMSYIFTESIAF